MCVAQRDIRSIKKKMQHRDTHKEGKFEKYMKLPHARFEALHAPAEASSALNERPQLAGSRTGKKKTV